MKPEQSPGEPVRSTEAGAAVLADFLRGLPSANRPDQAGTPLPELGTNVRQLRPEQDWVAAFTRAATAAGLHVHQAAAGEWDSSLYAVLQGCAAKAVFVAPAVGPTFTAERVRVLAAGLRDRGIEVRSAPDDETLFAVDAAITGVTAAIAETGTLVCTSSPSQARGASLIPPVHCALVGTGQLVPDLHDYLAGLAAVGELPANVNLISGPSKTADIEGVLVTGVHGPGEVHVILLDT